MDMEQELAIHREDPQRLAKPFEIDLKELIDCAIELRSMKPSALRANMAHEYAQRAKRFLDEVEASPLREHARRLHEAHRFATQLLNRVRKPVEMLQKLCSDIRSDWEVERRRRLEAGCRRLEDGAKRLAIEQRAAEVEHLKDMGKHEEAELRADDPIVPKAVSVDPDMGKPEGEVLVEVWIPERDERGEIVYSDFGAYLAWVAANPPMYHLVKSQFGKLKKLLTDNRGMLQPPGLKIEHKFETRTRAETLEVENE